MHQRVCAQASRRSSDIRFVTHRIAPSSDPDGLSALPEISSDHTLQVTRGDVAPQLNQYDRRHRSRQAAFLLEELEAHITECEKL
ncbi:hypothetical protein FEO87_09415 [Stenotrophomonas maltophilia]|nr:hypothetical protein FEO87_09415 [Stenotrophomonas maltophilia]